MGPEVVNKNRNCVFNGPYAGRDLYITMLEDAEREFVVTHNANIKPVSHFTGRETELQELRQRIEDGRKSVLVSGMGGIGKTHICRKLFEGYLNKYAESKGGVFKHIGYIEYNGDMGSSLQKCLKFKQQDSPEQNLEAAWRELEYLASDGELLLFVDNVDKPMWADPGLQQLNSIPGAVVLTSRQASFSDEFEPYQIGFLGMEQCKEIYEKIRFRGSSRKVGLEEVEDLEYVIESLAGRHTITVELLAHLARIKTWPVRKLREKLEEKGFCLKFHKGGELINIQKSYEALYDLSQLSQAEKNILEAFAIFPYIPLESDVCNQWLLSDAGVSEDDDILMGLYQKGWLQFDINLDGYALHPVFAQFIYEKCKPIKEDHIKLVEACRKNLMIPESGSALKCQCYIPFVESIIIKLNIGTDIENIGLLEAFAHLLQYTANIQKAEILYKKLLDIYINVFGEWNAGTAKCYNNLAYVYLRKKKYEKAEELQKKSLKIQKKVLGEKNSDTANSYNNLAQVYEKQQKYEKAEELYKKSLLIRIYTLGKENSVTAGSYNNLAYIYQIQGKYEKAKGLYKECIRIYEKELGESHPDTAIAYNNLALLYVKYKKYENALEYFLKAYKNLCAKLGMEHQYVQVAQKNMETIYIKMHKRINFAVWLKRKMEE